jgi:hypothetical protein
MYCRGPDSRALPSIWLDFAISGEERLNFGARGKPPGAAQ